MTLYSNGRNFAANLPSPPYNKKVRQILTHLPAQFY